MAFDIFYVLSREWETWILCVAWQDSKQVWWCWRLGDVVAHPLFTLVIEVHDLELKTEVLYKVCGGPIDTKLMPSFWELPNKTFGNIIKIELNKSSAKDFLHKKHPKSMLGLGINLRGFLKFFRDCFQCPPSRSLYQGK